MKKLKIAVCLPTYQEADTVRRATKVVDQGLRYYAKNAELFIVNADNNSPDGTSQIFLSTKTRAQKISIINKKPGKGYNLLAFFKWCQRNNIDAAATIDSDVSSSKADWMKLILNPILTHKIDYVIPGYARDRFDASITNHLAFPFVYAFFGRFLRQPIGGEFGFSKKLINYFLQQKTIAETGKFGIDIFMTIHALGSQAKIEEVFLGAKIHKPSLPKIYDMFLEVFASAFQSIQQYTPGRNSRPGQFTIGIHNSTQKRLKHTLPLAQQAITAATKHHRIYSKLFNPQLLQKVHSQRITDQDWAEVIAAFHAYITNNRFNLKHIRLAAQACAPLYVFRTIKFWEDIAPLEAKQIENLVLKQAQLLRRNILKQKRR